MVIGIELITTIAAVVAAIASVIGLYLQWQARQPQLTVKLKLESKWSRQHSTGAPMERDIDEDISDYDDWRRVDKFVVLASNSGPKTVTLKEWGIKARRNLIGKWQPFYSERIKGTQRIRSADSSVFNRVVVIQQFAETIPSDTRQVPALKGFFIDEMGKTYESQPIDVPTGLQKLLIDRID